MSARCRGATGLDRERPSCKTRNFPELPRSRTVPPFLNSHSPTGSGGRVRAAAGGRAAARSAPLTRPPEPADFRLARKGGATPDSLRAVAAKRRRTRNPSRVPRRLVPRHDLRRQERQRSLGGDGQRPLGQSHQPPAIGRASCRERGEISGGVVLLKKK